jgi:hypothetical protein
MSSKVAILHPETTTPSALLAQVANWEGLDGVVCMVRINDGWSTCWSSGINLGSLSMACLKLQADVVARMHDIDDSPTGPEGA